jgi:uncharacterized protein
MSKTVVADSTCLIGLSKIDQLDLLRGLFGRVLIPPAVFNEVVLRGSGRPGAAEVEGAGWIETQDAADRLAVNALSLRLGPGESEAIVLASEQAVEFIILDDWEARQVALGLSLPVIGTVAVLAKAEERGLIASLPVALGELRKAGFYYL